MEGTGERYQWTLGRDFGKLPDEVLGEILENASSRCVARAFRLSHVCQRFHRVALAFPRLWSTFSNLQSEEERDVALKRSSAAGVIIMIHRLKLEENHLRPPLRAHICVLILRLCTSSYEIS